MCQECHQKFFGGEFNQYTCPKCKVIYTRKNKKVNPQDFESNENND